MKHMIRAIVIPLVATLSCLIHPSQLQAHREYVHQYLAIEAYRLLLQKHPGLASTEFASHIGAQSGDCQGYPFTLSTVTGGAYREDCEDPVFHYGDVVSGLDKAYFSASHFWDADAGDASTIEICDLTCSGYNNAYQKTLRYVLPGNYGRWTAKLTWPAGGSSFSLQAGGQTTIFHSGLIGFEYDSLARLYRDGSCTITGYMDITGKWQTAATVPDQLPRKIIAPKAVRDRISWEVIGRIAHLLGDMGVPAHTHNDIHPPFWWNNEPADVYEEEMARLYTAWNHQDALAQGGLLDFRRALRPASVERVMRYLIYTTNQIADRFPSNDADGDDRYDPEWNGDDYSVLGMIGEIDADPRARGVFHREAAEYAFVYSIRSIAGLLDWFAQETGILARVTVDADVPGASVLVDGKPRTTPALLTFPAGTGFTLAAADQPGVDSVTGTPVTMKFNSWIRTGHAAGDAVFPGPRIEESAVDGTAYRARFDRVVTLTLAAARHLDGGSGGRYTVNGADAGGAWTGAVNTGATPSITVGFVPPAGSVFLGWSDGGATNPRMLSPTGNVGISALCKRRLASTVAPVDRPSNQRRIARLAAPDGAGNATVMAYESAGDIFFSGSADGIAWKPEVMLSDGRGNSRDPSIDEFTIFDGGGTTVVWEEKLAGSAVRRILARTMEPGGAAWGPAFVVDADSSGGAVRSTPSASGDLVVWKAATGIRGRRLSDGAAFTVPGTGPASVSPVADVYDGAQGKFAVSWIEAASGIGFIRGVFGGAWGSPRTVGAVAPPGEIRSVDVALSTAGGGCVAWLSSSAGASAVQYRPFDQGDIFQPATGVSPCPAGGNTPSLRLTHHRLDPSGLRDIGVHSWNPLTGSLATVVLKSTQRVGPSAIVIEPGHPEMPRAALSASGATPALLSRPSGDGYWFLTPALLPLAPALPAVPAPASPAHGATGVGPGVTLAWSCADDASSSDLQVDRTGTFSGAFVADRTGVTGTSVTVQNLSPGTTYYWRVRSVNSLGKGGYSQPRSFSTASLPVAPYLSGSVVSSPKGTYPKLTWSAVAGANSYRLYRYLCPDASDCGTSAPRPAIVYEGPLTTFTDGSVPVAAKTASGVARYYVAGMNAGFVGAASNVVSFPTHGFTVSSVDAIIPETSGLVGNYPNPFNPSTRVAYRLAGPGHVTISAFNLLAQRVATLVTGPKGAGFHDLSWDASGLPGGVYFLLMEFSPLEGAPRIIDRKKVVLLK